MQPHLIQGEVSISDMDGDSKPDLTVTSYGGTAFAILKNTSTLGSLSIGPYVSFPSASTRMGFVADIDFDNQPDVVNFTQSGMIAYHKNLGSCLPPVITSFTPTSSINGSTLTITGSNFNTVTNNNVVFIGAVKAPVLTATATQLTVTVPIAAARGQISVTDITTGLRAQSLLPFQQTFICGSPLSTSTLGATLSVSSTPNSVVINDLDGDGKPDISIAKNTGKLEVYRNSSSSTIALETPVTLTLEYNGGAIYSDDLNGDGKPDLVVMNETNALHAFKNTSTSGSISFQALPPYSLGYDNYILKLHDFDGDGRADIVAFDDWDRDDIRILKNISTSSSVAFQKVISFPTNSDLNVVAIADMNGDGKADLLIPHPSNYISYYRNTTVSGGPITFAAKVDFATTVPPQRLITGDVDGDDNPDILYGQYLDSKISLLRNTTSAGTLSFAPRIDLPTLGYNSALLLTDIDGDGKPEIISAARASNKASTFKNNSIPGTYHQYNTCQSLLVRRVTGQSYSIRCVYLYLEPCISTLIDYRCHC